MDWNDLSQPEPCGSSPLNRGANEEKVNSGIEYSVAMDDDCFSEDSNSQRDAQLQIEDARSKAKMQILDDSYTSYEFFDDECLLDMNDFQNKILPIPLIRTKRAWFKWHKNLQHIEKSTYSCRVCTDADEALPGLQRDKSILATKDGVLFDTYDKNYQTIYNHERTKVHQVSHFILL